MRLYSNTILYYHFISFILLSTVSNCHICIPENLHFLQNHMIKAKGLEAKIGFNGLHIKFII